MPCKHVRSGAREDNAPLVTQCYNLFDKEMRLEKPCREGT